MIDDIVARLKDAAWVPAGDDCETKDDKLFRESADEIERLRNELAYWRNMAITLGDYMANVPPPILEAYSAIWQVKYANKSGSND